MTKTYSQNVEKIFETVEKIFITDDIKHYEKTTRESPFGIYVDELNEKIEIMNGNWDGSTVFSMKEPEQKIKCNDMKSFWTDCNIRMSDNILGFSDSILTLQKNKEIYTTIKQIKSGISFILKKGSGYIVYFVGGKGFPGAADTEGKIYSNKEAVEYLKQYDSEKYEESLLRAEELGLKEKFLNSEVLVWGQRYYSSLDEMAKVLGKSGLILYDLIQYDMQGNAYQIDFGWWGNYKNDWGVLFEEGTEDNSDFVCEDVNGNRTVLLSNLNEYSKILGRNGDYQEKRPAFSTSWYVGFGGNIYYYIAGEEYTEVFRIRRTWGDPDFYAMAVNGYTEDEYGKYVNEVLPKLSKAELRLLRNTVFALYGVHFKSEDLSTYFDKQVWYTDEGKTSAEVTLPVHRQKLVEMIQALEK